MDPRLLEEGTSQVTSEEDQRRQREEANCQVVVQEQSPGPEQQSAKGGGSRTGNGRNYTMAQCPNHWLTLKISLDLVTVM